MKATCTRKTSSNGSQTVVRKKNEQGSSSCDVPTLYGGDDCPYCGGHKNTWPPLSVSIDDAAKLIGVSRRTMSNLIKDDANEPIPSFTIRSRRLILFTELEQWLVNKSKYSQRQGCSDDVQKNGDAGSNQRPKS